MKVIQIVENLNKGAVENWLVRTFLESRNSSSLDWTFFCVLGTSGILDERVIQAGGKIIYSPYSLSEKKKFLQFLRLELQEGKYDFFHSHHDYLTGFYFLAAVGIPFKGKFVHVHNCEKSLPVANPSLHKILIRSFSTIIRTMADKVIGVSKHALNKFSATTSRNGQVVYCGIDFTSFKKEVDIVLMKEHINLPTAGKVLLFVGRLYALKNPLFVVKILKEILKSDKHYYAVFIGTGELEEEILSLAKELNIENNIRLLGYRQDVDEIMNISNVLVFPRVEETKEGLGLVVVEAQAAGLPVVVSNGIVDDAFEIRDLVTVLPLNNNAKEWAAKILEIEKFPLISKSKALQLMENSKFSIHASTKEFLRLYND